MARVLIFAPFSAEDAPLWNSRWIARQTMSRLEASRLLEDREAVRLALEAALGEESFEGVVLCGHGKPHAVMGADGREALSLENTTCVQADWVHMMACETGIMLVPACGGHAALFIGYRVKLIVDFTIEELPAGLLDLLSRLVTSTTLALASGVRTRAELQRSAAQAAEALVAWLDENQVEGLWGLHALANQLVDRMVLSR